MRWRSGFTFLPLCALFYAYGEPVFDGIRPAALNEPFHEFHAEVGSKARSYWGKLMDPSLSYFEKAYASR